MNLSRTLGQLEASAQLQAVFEPEDLADLPVIFDFFDTERTGSVHGSNVERMLFLLGYIVQPNTIKASRLYTLDDFLNMAGRCQTKDEVRKDEKKVARKVFQMIDISCHGTVDPVHMHRFLKSAGAKCTHEQAVQLVAAVDRTDDDADCFGVDDLHYFLQKFGALTVDDGMDDMELPSHRSGGSGSGSGSGEAGGAGDGHGDEEEGGGEGEEGESKGVEGDDGEAEADEAPPSEPDDDSDSSSDDE